MNEQEFKNNFITTFMSTWCAVNYSDFCMNDNAEGLANPPVEDAIELANDTYKLIEQLQSADEVVK